MHSGAARKDAKNDASCRPREIPVTIQAKPRPQKRGLSMNNATNSDMKDPNLQRYHQRQAGRSASGRAPLPSWCRGDSLKGTDVEVVQNLPSSPARNNAQSKRHNRKKIYQPPSSSNLPSWCRGDSLNEMEAQQLDHFTDDQTNLRLSVDSLEESMQKGDDHVSSRYHFTHRAASPVTMGKEEIHHCSPDTRVNIEKERGREERRQQIEDARLELRDLREQIRKRDQNSNPSPRVGEPISPFKESHRIRSSFPSAVEESLSPQHIEEDIKVEDPVDQTNGSRDYRTVRQSNSLRVSASASEIAEESGLYVGDSFCYSPSPRPLQADGVEGDVWACTTKHKPSSVFDSLDLSLSQKQMHGVLSSAKENEEDTTAIPHPATERLGIEREQAKGSLGKNREPVHGVWEEQNGEVRNEKMPFGNNVPIKKRNLLVNPILKSGHESKFKEAVGSTPMGKTTDDSTTLLHSRRLNVNELASPQMAVPSLLPTAENASSCRREGRIPLREELHPQCSLGSKGPPTTKKTDKKWGPRSSPVSETEKRKGKEVDTFSQRSSPAGSEASSNLSRFDRVVPDTRTRYNYQRRGSGRVRQPPLKTRSTKPAAPWGIGEEDEATSRRRELMKRQQQYAAKLKLTSKGTKQKSPTLVSNRENVPVAEVVSSPPSRSHNSQRPGALGAMRLGTGFSIEEEKLMASLSRLDVRLLQKEKEVLQKRVESAHQKDEEKFEQLKKEGEEMQLQLQKKEKMRGHLYSPPGTTPAGPGSAGSTTSSTREEKIKNGSRRTPKKGDLRSYAGLPKQRERNLRGRSNKVTIHSDSVSLFT